MELQDRSRITVVGARDHNLKDVDLSLPKHRLICFTGVSGSGKSTMAFDTLYAEGQRRYVESLSSYARQFMGQLPKPNVDQITGLSPSISIQQKSTGWNPRSTIGTITQIHDYMRVLFARAGTPHCTSCGRPIAAQTREQMLAGILALPEATRFLLLAPKIRAQKGEYKDLFADLIREGFVRARVDGEVIELAHPPELDRYRRHDIEVVIDRLVLRPGVRPRLAEALDTALRVGEGLAIVAPTHERENVETWKRENSGSPEGEGDEKVTRLYPEKGSRKSSRDPASPDHVSSNPAGDILLSAHYACVHCNLSFEPPNPQMLSFNSPQGMCMDCDGLGTRFDFDPALLVPDPTRAFCDPCIAALRTPPGKWRRHIYEGVARHVGFDLSAPWCDLPEKARKALLYGTGKDHITFEWRSRYGVWKHGGTFEGIIPDLHARHKKATSQMVRSWYEQFMSQSTCPTCRGARLNAQALSIRLTGRMPAHDNREKAGKREGKKAAASHNRRARPLKTNRLSAPSLQQSGGSDSHASAHPFPPSRVPNALNIDEVCRLSIREAQDFFNSLELSETGRIIAAEPLKEIRSRLQFLLDVGLDYLTLGRTAPSLSGGESQRIRLASQIGCGLVGVLYVLDEPSIGLHPRDNQRLLASLMRLRDMGNTVVVVEHDEDTMRAADWIVDFGPGPGVRGGRVVASGKLDDLARESESITGAYLSGRQTIPIPPARRPVVKKDSTRVRSPG